MACWNKIEQTTRIFHLRSWMPFVKIFRCDAFVIVKERAVCLFHRLSNHGACPLYNISRVTRSIMHNPSFDVPSDVNNKTFFLSFICSFNLFIYLFFTDENYLSFFHRLQLRWSLCSSKFKLYTKWFDFKFRKIVEVKKLFLLEL